MSKSSLLHLFAAIAVGAALWFVMNLDPVWWLVWIVPGLLFALALRSDGWASRGLVVLSALIGAASNLAFFLRIMPLVPVLLITALQALLWLFVFGMARRVVRRFESAWTVLALPLFAVAADTLLAHLTPDGNWGSLGYTQADAAPVVQIASVFGIGGVLFLVMLFNSALALAITCGARLRGAWSMYGATALTVALAVGFGWWRLQTPVDGTPVSFGIASVDDYINESHSEHAGEIWSRYGAQVNELAAAGAKLVLLPEKIDVLPAADAEVRKQQLSALALAARVWLVVGLGVDTGTQRRNEAWWFAPDGRLVTNYLKHFMAPPEREFVPGSEFPVNDIEGVRYGVAICKDMHFASLGRGFGERDPGVMIVPAWDFDDDAWMAANMTRMRGIENGYTIIRSARNGLLSVSDAYGRMLVVERSAKLPGTTLLATVTVGARVPTIYTRIGDLLGWLCVAVAAALLLWPLLRRTRTSPVPIS